MDGTTPFTPAPTSIARITADLVVASAALRRLGEANIRAQCAAVEYIRARGKSVDDLTVSELVAITNEVLS